MKRLASLLFVFVTLAAFGGCATAPNQAVNHFNSGKCYGPDYTASDCIYKF